MCESFKGVVCAHAKRTQGKMVEDIHLENGSVAMFRI